MRKPPPLSRGRLSPLAPYAAEVTAPQDPGAPRPDDAPTQPQPGYGPPPGSPPPPDYGQPQPWDRPAFAGATQTSTKAVIALCLAIAAYTPIVPFVGAILALFLSASAKRDIQASGGQQTGLPLCTAATIISVVHLVFIGLLIVLVLGVIALPFSFS